MPTYEYICKNCGTIFEKIMSLRERLKQPLPQCPKCKSRKVEQKPSSFQAVTAKKA